MGYLYLFYADYLAENGSPYGAINTAKNAIKQKALSQMKQRSASSVEVEHLFEQKYNLHENDFGSIDFLNTKEFNDINVSLTTFDTAIGRFKELLSQNKQIAEMQEQGRLCVSAIEDILQKGAQTGGLADGAIAQVKRGLEKLRIVRRAVKYAGPRKNHKDEILDALSDIESNVSGYALEIATVYGAVNAEQYGMKKLHETMINTGSNSIGGKAFKTFKEDPKMLDDLQELTEVLNLNSTQAKADSVINLHASEGNGSVTGNVEWVGFQEKNYESITSIQLLEKTLGELGIFSYYDQDVLVNLTGGLGNNYKNNNIMHFLVRNPEYGDTQGNLDQVWLGVRNSMKLLCAVDGIAGYLQSNFTNKVNYYVIRRKTDGQVSVIGVSRILDRIVDALNSDKTSALGINWGEMTSNQYNNRSVYWKHSTENFQRWSPTAAQTRSDKAYPQIINEINKTKVTISLNFSSFFT